jgi:hypothetical protein
LAFARFGIAVDEPEIIAVEARNWTIGDAQKRANASASAYRRAADEIQGELGAIYRLSEGRNAFG